MKNDFIWPTENYKQDINPVMQYIKQAANFLSIQRGISKEEAEDFVKKTLKDKSVSNFHDPSVVFYERNDNYVRELKEGTLSGYLMSAIKNEEVIVPTMTTYCNENVQKSLTSEFMKRNAGRRAILKHKSQEEEARGNLERAFQLNNLQDNAKRNNSSMSGATAAAGSIFENPTGHNTLTSMTRSMSSISNALNERMISGNRHYMDPQTVVNNMTVIATSADLSKVRECLDVFHLKAPTAEDIGKIVSKSTDKYWRDRRHIQKIVEYAEKMSPEQRAAFAYTQDLYHIRILNPDFMRGFIEDFANCDTSIEIEDPVKYIKQTDPLITNYAHQVFISDLKGKDKDRSTWQPELALKVAQACATIDRAIKKYYLLINTFLVVDTVPCSTAYINHMSRESVVLSDTDSTMFSIDEWVMWYFGELIFTDYAFAVSGCVMFVSTQLIAHALAILSANMNVARDKMHILAMKPEFVFPVFAQTPVAKHYFCSMSVKEGAVYKNNKYEIKGVHLKNSAITVEIIGKSKDRMIEILERIQAGKKINNYSEIKRVADLEREIIASVSAGETKFLKRMFVNKANSYKLDETKSPYRHHTLWNKVFGPSYVEMDAPPYTILKLPMTTTTKRGMSEWLASFEDTALAERYRKYLKETDRDVIKTMYIAQDFVQAYGMPKEIRTAIDFRKIVLDLTVADRMILETIGHRPKYGTLLSEQSY